MMSELNSIIHNMTNQELVDTCFSSGFAVNSTMVREMCERLENLTGQVRMWHTLSDKSVEINKNLLDEMKAFQSELKELKGD